MADDRDLAPSPRRRALAHQAGLVPRAPGLTAAGAWLGAIAGASWVAAHGRSGLADAVVRATDAAPSLPSLAGTVVRVAALALPLLCGALLGAVGAHLLQVRRAWLPRRRIAGAPVANGSAAQRARAGLLAVLRLLLVGGVIAGWLIGAAPALARLLAAPVATWPAAAVAIVAAAALTIGTTLVIAGALDLGIAWWQHLRDLRQSAAERREELAAAGGAADHRRLRHGAQFAGAHVSGSPAGAVRRARVVLTDGSRAVAVAIQADAPTIVAVGRGVDALELVALARRYDVALHRDARLAATLLEAGLGRAPPAAWGPLADIVAALAPPA